ncbi:MAG: 5-formyltetrahydrofolate cyclo-ligase [Candidatus Omnitrophica bacterium]|nr:5-formyltetrahydrofolate cyclo-ligase [Candidatus Omnitrophota bacterium]
MNSDNIALLKDKIRKEIIGELRGQAPLLRSERSRRIQEKLISSEEFRSGRTIMTYVSLVAEVDTGLLNKRSLEMGKRVVVPFIDTENQTIIASELTSIDDLVNGPYGIKVPRNGSRNMPLEEIDLIVVPAIAYDKNNMRLGRGKGYYDRFLVRPELSSAKTVGLAFHFQVVDLLPADPDDIPVSRVITD